MVTTGFRRIGVLESLGRASAVALFAAGWFFFIAFIAALAGEGCAGDDSRRICDSAAQLTMVNAFVVVAVMTVCALLLRMRQVRGRIDKVRAATWSALGVLVAAGVLGLFYAGVFAG